MPALPPKGMLDKRRPSLKGIVMMDVSNGAERVRAWPRKRSSIKNQTTLDQMEWFRQAQWATKYMAPAQMVAFAEATKGTPLLPRDLATMMFAGRMMNFNMADGRKINSMSTVASVSDSLDVFTQTPGKTLMRGQQLWEAVDPIVGSRYGAHLTRTALYDIAVANAFESIPWTAEILDQALFWSNVTPTNINIIIPGWYNCTFNTHRMANAGDVSTLAFYVNGVQEILTQFEPRTTGSGLRQTLSAPLFIPANSILQCRVADSNAAARYENNQFRIVGPA